jgi:hypothetical protein
MFGIRIFRNVGQYTASRPWRGHFIRVCNLVLQKGRTQCHDVQRRDVPNSLGWRRTKQTSLQNCCQVRWMLITAISTPDIWTNNATVTKLEKNEDFRRFSRIRTNYDRLTNIKIVDTKTLPHTSQKTHCVSFTKLNHWANKPPGVGHTTST